jgi:hypothetical protein
VIGGVFRFTGTIHQLTVDVSGDLIQEEEAERRLLMARFDGKAGQWRITQGSYRVALGKSADDFALTAEAPLEARLFGS